MQQFLLQIPDNVQGTTQFLHKRKKQKNLLATTKRIYFLETIKINNFIGLDTHTLRITPYMNSVVSYQ